MVMNYYFYLNMEGVNELNDNVMARKNTRHIGNNVRRTREIRGLLQNQLADMLGVKPQTVCEYESSKTLRKTTLEKIANALKVSPEFIEDFNDEAFNNSITNIINAENINGAGIFSPDVRGDFTYNSISETLKFLQEQIIYFRDLSLRLQEELLKKG